MKTAIEIILLIVFLVFNFVLARNYDTRNKEKTTIDDALDICGMSISMFIVGLCAALLFA